MTLMDRSTNDRMRAIACAAALMAFAACADDSPTQPDEQQVQIEVRTIAAPVLPNMSLSVPAMSTCTDGTTYDMWGGRAVPGTVTISNDAETLYVTYHVDGDGYFISDTRLEVARTEHGIPRYSPGGPPNPWAFTYSGEHEPVIRAHTYALPLADLGYSPGEKIVVSVMAGVVYPTTSDWSGPWEWRTVWAATEVQEESAATIHEYTLATCGSTTPPPAPAPGRITLTFDDGWLTTHTNVFPILQELGLVGNVAVNPEPVDGLWTGYMHIEELHDLHEAGWAMVAHGWGHRDLTTLSDTELHAELRNTQSWLDGHGFRGSDVFVVPFHSWGERERNAIAQYYTATRGYSANQFWPSRMVTMPTTTPHELTGFEPEYAPFTTSQGRDLTMSYVARAAAEGEFIDIFFHRIEPEHVPAFRALMERIAEYRDHIVTYDELF